ncbi:hypothetical protein EDB81DRAFT_799325 [Dactylonectria macrodidyma]|uniref:Uncharacterized protein n=1 Tax=Dactylonectria macrodidyma TaxID=307937 RepID=A0A9P9EPV9_9HYPO|nr:hypothetical protein EDB81DRAFT_799325 [Dactylonectria macrodidyma]
MPLLDKMSLWRSRDDEDAKPQVEVDDYFHGVKDDEDEHDQIENIGLSVYQRVISDSQAYKWFISTCKKEVTLQQGATNRCTMTNESIRGSLLEKLPTGTISKRHAPSSHEVTFVLQSRQLIAMRLARTTVKPGTWPVQSFSNVVVLTGSVDHAQALTIKQYMSQTWPANGTQMLEALEDGITNPKNLIYGKSPANTPLVVGIQDALLMVKARGPAYFIAECGEQLAWLASAFSTVHRNGLCGVTPLINKIHIWQAASRSSGCSGLCKLGVDSTAVFDLDHSLSPATESCWQALVGRLKLIQGYPIARRPEGYPGLEISLELLLSLVQAGKVSVHPTKVLIEGSKRSLQLVKRTDNVCLWHLVDSITECCACDKVPVVNNTALWKDRHILGSCKPQDDDDTRLMNTRPSGSICQSNAATKTKSITALDEEPPYVFGRRKEVVRKLSIRRASQVPVLEDHASATPVTLPRSHGSPQSAAEPDSGDDSFDTDQLSISDSSEPAERLDVNDPQYLALRSVLVRLLSGYRTRAQYPSPAQQNGQGAPTSAVNLSNSENRGTSNPNNWKRKRGDDDRDDADQDGFQRPPQKKINCDPAEAQKKSFACPFLKKDPVEHRDCCTRKLSRIRDVKQHLARRHTPERYCQLCFETSFADQRSLQHHISERSCLSQEPSTLEGISYDQRQQLSKKSNPNITEEGQWFVIWDIIFPESLKPTSAYLDTGLSVEMRLFREYSQTHGPVMIREQILASPYNMRQGSLEEQQSALDRVIAEGITRLFETWRSAQSTGSRPSRNQANNNAQAGQATPLSSIADSGFATASQVSPLEARSRIEGSVQNSSILETSCPPPAGMAAEIQDSEQAQGLPMGSSDIYNQDWFAILASTDNMGQFYTNRNEFELGSAFD